jgi:cytochrome c biogenesis protein CcmG/thiol:disulfide interchange protein DsbE
MRRLPLALAVIAAFVLALGACGSEGDAPTAPAKPAADLPSEGGKLIGGGTSAFKSQLRELKGTPVVVNQWASWCGPCKFEFPFFAALAREYQGRVAFLGVNSQDGRQAAQEFLRERPVPYPNFFDPEVKIAREFRGGLAWPTTAFYDEGGELVETHAGAYASQAKLDEDIRRYALGQGA